MREGSLVEGRKKVLIQNINDIGKNFRKLENFWYDHKKIIVTKTIVGRMVQCTSKPSDKNTDKTGNRVLQNQTLNLLIY